MEFSSLLWILIKGGVYVSEHDSSVMRGFGFGVYAGFSLEPGELRLRDFGVCCKWFGIQRFAVLLGQAFGWTFEARSSERRPVIFEAVASSPC